VTLVVAHRGAHGPGVAENSPAAFERAIALGADMAELDVRREASGRLVVRHDPLGAGGGRAPEAPSLADVLALCRGRLALDVELKEDGYVAEVAALLDAGTEPGALVVTSFLDAVVAQLAELLPGVPRGLLVDADAGALDGAALCARAAACSATGLAIPASLADDDRLDAARRAGLGMVVWDVCAGPEMARLLADERVEAICTDDVAEAVAARDASPPEACSPGRG
jgi:glycerophosphoryl diester phosphodiesterase